MQERRVLTDRQMNRDLLDTVLNTRLWHIALLLLTGALATAGVLTAAYLFNRGVGILGVNRPVMWGFLIVNFIFWVGISHAGVMISAILRLAQAEWRRPVTRAAEVLTVFALATAALHPLIHAGRPWRIAYWILPYDFHRGIFPNVRSPLIWDPSAIFTYLTGSTLFVFVALLPDIAIIRDRTRGLPHAIYSALAMGWRGTPRQWKLQAVAGILLSALILPVFVSVHSIVSWDFAIAIATEAWHATVFAPYFVIGAVHSGVSGVVTMMALLRWLFRLEDYIRPEHFDALGRLLIVVATAWFYFFFLEILFGLWLQEPPETELRTLQLLTPPWAWMFIVLLVAGYVIPVGMWLSRRVRRNIALMFWTSILVNIGMWMERFVIIVPGLMRKTPFTFTWDVYRPTVYEFILVASSFGLVATGLLVFSKLFPLIPIWEQKEGQVFWDDVKVGQARVGGIIKE